MTYCSGPILFQHPGPTNIPDRVLRAMDRNPIDHMSAEFQGIFHDCQDKLRALFRTRHSVLAHTSSGHGAWEAAMVNLFSAKDKVLVIESGFFSRRWAEFGIGLGLQVEVLRRDWRLSVDPADVKERLEADVDHTIKAVMVVHNETSTGVTNDIAQIRAAIDGAGHPALFLVDAISSLACIPFDMDALRIDVAVSGSQKGLMLPVGLCFTSISDKALAASEKATLPRAYWDWRRMMNGTRQIGQHGTQPVNIFFGLHESLKMLESEGIKNVIARHHRLAAAVRKAVEIWTMGGGVEFFATEPRSRSDTVTAVMMGEGHDAEEIRAICESEFCVVLASGLGELKGRIFRIGHLGALGPAVVIGALGAIEIALVRAGVQIQRGGVDAAMNYLETEVTSPLAKSEPIRLAAVKG